MDQKHSYWFIDFSKRDPLVAHCS